MRIPLTIATTILLMAGHGDQHLLAQPIPNPYIAGPVLNQGSMNMAPTTPHGDVLGLLRQATELEKQGQLPAAVQLYQRALQLNPSNWQAMISLARAEHRGGDLDGAIRTYQQVLMLYPNEPLSLNDLGLCLARKGDISGAIEVLGQAVQAAPFSKRYRNNLATVLIESNRLNDALAILRDVHGDAIGEFNLGFLLAQRGRHPEAAEHLRMALQLDPSLTPARDMLASLGNQPRDRVAMRSDSRPTAQRSDGMAPTPAVTRRIQLQSGSAPEPGDHAPVGQVRRAEFLETTRTQPAAAAGPSIAPDPADYNIPGLD